MEKINIVLATDDNYVQHCAVTIVSILRKNNNISFYILNENLTEQNKQILNDEVSTFHADVHFVTVDRNIIDSLPMPSYTFLSHISRATYYRLLLPNLMHQDIDKVIYLDCDLLVNTSLDDLWSIDIENSAIAACKQIGGLRDAYRLGIPKEYGYFNAGVLLINIKYWRDNDISNQLVSYLFNNGDNIIFHDQDALNAVLYDKCVSLHQQWNMNFATYSKEFLNLSDEYGQEITEAKLFQQSPSILHYSARIKPWDWRCTHPLVNYYYDNAKYTQHFNHLKGPSIFEKYLAIFRENIIHYLVKGKHLLINSFSQR